LPLYLAQNRPHDFTKTPITWSNSDRVRPGRAPYAILLTGPTTVANLFFNMASGKMGLVGIWDAIGFDEVADLQKMPKEVVTTLKTYCESGTFARGKDSLSGMASIAMFGNTNQPVEVMVRSSHLFMPMPDVIREDMAFLDRIHFYIPGWGMPKMKVDFFETVSGLVKLIYPNGELSK
jgi:ATP-dependent Lon protease